jgi:hypothetical protein
MWTNVLRVRPRVPVMLIVLTLPGVIHAGAMTVLLETATTTVPVSIEYRPILHLLYSTHYYIFFPVRKIYTIEEYILGFIVRVIFGNFTKFANFLIILLRAKIDAKLL